uniref:Uncharacterized protein n=1 Tax=Anguilla anguilla TaxID=7936 RepID=A0A0E9WQY7_ANGAN
MCSRFSRGEKQGPLWCLSPMRPVFVLFVTGCSPPFFRSFSPFSLILSSSLSACEARGYGEALCARNLLMLYFYSFFFHCFLFLQEVVIFNFIGIHFQEPEPYSLAQTGFLVHLVRVGGRLRHTYDTMKTG